MRLIATCGPNGRRLWRVSVLNQRSALKAVARSSPSLRRVAASFLSEAHEEVLSLVERTIPDLELGSWPERRRP